MRKKYSKKSGDLNPESVRPQVGVADIPQAAGIITPAYIDYSISSGFAHVPIALQHCNWVPVGVGTSTYTTIGAAWRSALIARLANLGYENTYTTGNLGSYFGYFGQLYGMVAFVHNLFRLQENSHIHRSNVINTLTSIALNGRLKLVNNMAIKMLESMRFPSKMLDFYRPLFHGTTLSENPNSGIRMLSPIDTPFCHAVGTPILPEDMSDEIETVMALFTGVVAQLSQVLPFPNAKLDLPNGPFTFNRQLVNFLLNTPSSNNIGIISPTASEDDFRALYFRRGLDLVSLSGIGSGPSDYLGFYYKTADAAYLPRDHFETTGVTVSSDATDPALIQAGHIWDNGVATGNVYPGVTKVGGTHYGVALAIAQQVFSD